ncbi:MAG: Calx-beta domain-containing protein, partial [Verrucomicrobiales bacterium]|nr:Calx-beta domain-containing protein [Verrucomicrobiales bacterium]
MVAETGPGRCTAVVNFKPVATDDCDTAPLVESSPPSGSAFAPGVTLVTVTATDHCGNQAQCTFTVTVLDAEPPTVLCPPSVTVSADAGKCFATNVRLGAPVANDNCGPAFIGNDAPAQFPIGTTRVTWTVRDAAGNTAACEQMVTVLDTEPPLLVCPANVIVSVDDDQCFASNVALGQPAARDNCGVVALSHDAPPVFPPGVTTVTWTARDAHGNSATCSQRVIVIERPLPMLTLSDITVTEGDDGMTDAVMTLSLSWPSCQSVKVRFATTDDTATAPGDYVAAEGEVSFSPGETTKLLTLRVRGDTLNEADESFLVRLTTPDGATLSDAEGLVTITDDDPVPTVSIEDANLREGDDGDNLAEVSVRLSRPSGQIVMVEWATADGSARAPDDYVANGGHGALRTGGAAPGATSEPAPATTLKITRVGQRLAVSWPRALTGYVLQVANTLESGRWTTLATEPALQGDEYVVTRDPRRGAEFYRLKKQALPLLIFQPGETARTISLTVRGDRLNEEDEVFFVNLTHPVNAALGQDRSQFTILDDDPQPALSVRNASVQEGDIGAANVGLEVALSAPSGKPVSATWATADGTALAALDYAASEGVVHFAPGETSKFIDVAVFGDALDEPDET